jgi:putative membrane protein
LLEIAKKAEDEIGVAKYEILENQTEVKIMGQEIFQDFSKALDNSLRITKMIMIGCAVLFLTSLFL